MFSSTHQAARRIGAGHRRHSAAAMLIAVGAVAVSSTVTMPASAAADWNGKVSPIIKDANARVMALSDAKVNKWFGVPKRYDHVLDKSALNADATTTDPTTAQELGRVQVIYEVTWPEKAKAPVASVVAVYRNGTFKKIKHVDDAIVGSFGFAQPKLDLPKGIKLANKFKKDNPADIPAEFALEGAQLQKADAPPPTLEKLRWVVSYRAQTGQLHQVLVYMNGKVELGM